MNAVQAESEAAAGPANAAVLTEARSQGVIVVESAQTTVVPPATGRRLYQVREGDGLWIIAQQFLPAGTGDNIYQMLLSLHDLNRAAFINGNISLLKANALLQIPDAEDIAAVPAATAEDLFEQRWAEGTERLQTALRGEPLPEFTPLYESGRSEAGPQAELEDAREPGQEAGRSEAVAAGGLLLPANTPVVVAATDGEEAAAGVVLREPVTISLAGPTPDDTATVVSADMPAPVSEAAEMPAAAGDQSNSQPATGNPYLDRIDGSTRDLRDLLQNRSTQIAQLEQQLVDMRQRMRDAQEVTSRLNAALEQALAEREARSAPGAGTAVLGLVALVLLVVLVMAMVMLLKLTSQLRSQRRVLHDVIVPPRGANQDGAADVVDRPMNTFAAGSLQPHPHAEGIVVHEEAPDDMQHVVWEDAQASLPNSQGRVEPADAHADESLQQQLLDFIGPHSREDDELISRS